MHSIRKKQLLSKALVFLPLLFPFVSNAIELTFLDQQGAPVTGVVVVSDGQPEINIDSVLVIDQVDREFVPMVSLLYAGQKADFPNSDNIRHHVYSFSQSNPFEIKLYRNRPSEPILFQNPGIVTLGCNIHDDMLGYIFVAKQNQLAQQTDENGKVTLGNADSFSYWHPRLTLSTMDVVKMNTSDMAENNQVVLDLVPLLPSAKGKTFGSN